MQQYRVIVHDIDWESLIAPEHWKSYKCVLDELHGKRCRLPWVAALQWAFTRALVAIRKTSIFIFSRNTASRAIDMMGQCGLEDYFDVRPYNREWIYRAFAGDVIVDSIWAMANRRAEVDEGWLSRGPLIRMFGQEFRAIPPEELIWSKLYVLQRDRCDWPDILNLICATGPNLDWNHLIQPRRRRSSTG